MDDREMSSSESSDEEDLAPFLATFCGPLDCFDDRIPRNNSILQGRDWVGELIHSESETRFFDAVRISRPVFQSLVQKLKPLLPEPDQCKVPIEEAIIMFMRIVAMHLRQRDTQERFQHSLETVHRQFHRVLNAIVSLAPELVAPPLFDHLHPTVGNNPRLYPFFKDAVGAIDGTLIHAAVPADRQNAWRSRKGTVSQNVIAACDFDLKFTYVYAGWEGSATDAHILQHAIQHSRKFPWPPQGKYFLVDAGFSNYPAFLAPYRSTRYHLQEYHQTRLQPRTPEELFNYRHSQLRNHIERTFGILKSRFAILRYGMPKYKIRTQVKIVIACCALHNFIRMQNMPDILFDGMSTEYADDDDIFSHRHAPTTESVEEQSQFRDGLAAAMWEHARSC